MIQRSPYSFSQLALWMSLIRQSPGRRLFAADGSPRKNQISRPLLPYQRRQSCASYRRITPQRNLRKPPLRFTVVINKITDHCQFSPAAKTSATPFSNGDLAKFSQPPDHPIKFLQQGRDLLRRMDSNISAGKKSLFPAGEN